jgi:hypothetical protein
MLKYSFAILRCCILSAFLIILFPSCNVLDDVFGEKNYKTIIIYDYSHKYTDMKLSAFEGRYVILVLSDSIPELNAITMDRIRNMPYSIGQVHEGVLEVRLNTELNYWDGVGQYWIFFLITDGRADRVFSGVVSKEMHNINRYTTRISNEDFIKAQPLDIDISEQMPF